MSLALLRSSVIPTGSVNLTVSRSASAALVIVADNAPVTFVTRVSLTSVLKSPLTLINSTVVAFVTASFTVPNALVFFCLRISPLRNVTGLDRVTVVTSPLAIVRNTSANLSCSLAYSGVSPYTLVVVLAFCTASTGVIALLAGVSNVPGATVAVKNGSVKILLTSSFKN